MLSALSKKSSKLTSYSVPHFIKICVRNIASDASPPEDIAKNCEKYDIIIAGGGLVGTTLACAIANHKILSEKKILLLEGAPKFKFSKPSQYSNRVSALNLGTVKLLKGIGAWNTISAERYKCVKQMQVWDANSDALVTFNHKDFCDNVAYIVENDLILHAVYKELEKYSNVEVRNQSKVEKVWFPKDGTLRTTVMLKDEQKMSCDLLVGADGYNSLVRREMGIHNFTSSYNQMGLVATLELDEVDENSVAWQRFTPSGVVALLPLNNRMSSLVWSTSPHHAAKLKNMSAEDFVDAVNEAYIKEVPKSNIVINSLNAIDNLMGLTAKATHQYPPRVLGVLENSRACFPLGFGHAPSYVAEGVALIGDAAHRVHPLAGQGVNLGFGDVRSLTEVLARAVYSGFKLGDKQCLLQYEKERLINNVPIMIGIHGIQKLYSTTFAPIVFLRSVGLKVTQNTPLLKEMFMKRAIN